MAWLELAHGCWANHGQLRPSESRCKGREVGGGVEREEPWGLVGVVLVLASVLCVTMQGHRHRGGVLDGQEAFSVGGPGVGVWSLFPRVAWG